MMVVVDLIREQLKANINGSLTPDPSPEERGVVTFAIRIISSRTIYAPLLGRGVGGEALIHF
jgi:hypothetical protein